MSKDGKFSANDYQVGGTHYKDMPIQPWDLMEILLTTEEFTGYLKGCLIKYVMRDGTKPGAVDDADKAVHYKKKLEEFIADIHATLNH